jgi:phosphopantothenoylcysteine decarboxylase/phosphopantothenate--cysteine ligase
MSHLEAHLRFNVLEAARLHLGVCGSAAAFRALDLLRYWQAGGIAVSVTLTPSARRFVTPLSFEALGASPVYGDMFDAHAGPFAHLEAGKIAQAMVIAPATANTLARLAHGLADDMLACQALAHQGPLVLAPAINPRMSSHPATQASVALLTERGARLVMPESGSVACGDEGQGRLADLREIYLAGLKALSVQDMAGMRAMITLGPTREQWDAARFWSNPSSGVMGASCAVAAWLRGAEVDAVCGPGSPWLPAGIRRYDIAGAGQMFDAALALWPSAHCGIFTAAVADFAPEPYGSEKFKKAGAAKGFSLKFTPNPDILQTLAARRRPDQKVVGFAAEASGDLGAAVRSKLQTKGADLVVGNRIGQEGAGFGSPTNVAHVADAAGREEEWPLMPKTEAAWRICSWLLRL